MNDIVISVENLSKLYRIGQTVGPKSLRKSVTDAVTTYFRRLCSPRHKSLDTGQELRTPTALSDTGLKPGYFWALKDVSFQVKRGEAVGIIGKNGSGKSTLLKILARVTTPTEGSAQIRGRLSSLLEIGTGFHPELTGRENIFLSAAIMGLKKAEIERKFDEIVAFSEVEEFIDTPVKHYSSGMYVRLGFSVSVQLEPDILLVDEVLAVGDVDFQKKSISKIRELVGGGRTVLFVSHSMGAVQELCNRAILLDKGHVIEDAPSQTVIADYLSLPAESEALRGDVDVSHPSLHRGSLADSQFYWTRVTMLNSAGKATALLKYGEPYEIVLQGFSTVDLSEVRAGFSIDAAAGSAIFNSFQIDNGISGRMPRGSVRFLVRFDPNLLAPGRYQVNLSARGEGVNDLVPSALQFKIGKGAEEDENAWRSYHVGIMRHPCRWKME